MFQVAVIFKWHLLSNEAASLTVLSGIYCQTRQHHAYCLIVLSAICTEESLEYSSGQLLERYLESLRSVTTLEKSGNKLRRGCIRFHVLLNEPQNKSTPVEELSLRTSKVPGA